MAVANVALQGFNRGLISKYALARTDVPRTALSAQDMVNWVPRVLGPMSLRPGWRYLVSTHANASARYLPFVFSTDDTALVELTDITLRVLVADVLVSRAAVSTAVTNGTFNTDLTGWTDADEAGATSSWAAGGYLQLASNDVAAAIRRQQVTVAGGDQNKEHGLRIVIARGPVVCRVGSTIGGEEYVSETSLDTGVHSFSVVPGGDIHIQFQSSLARLTLVDSCTIEAAGAIALPTTWTVDDLDFIRVDQSGDILFCACVGQQQRKIERRATRSWSFVYYYANDGPFEDENDGPITITPSALTGNITLTASAPLFRSTHVGGLWRVTSSGQRVFTQVTGAAETFSNPIRVSGIDSQRIFTVIRSNTWTGTVTLQRSLEEPGTWEDVATYTTSATITFDDTLDNQIAYYRIGTKAAGWASGVIDLELRYALGSIDGVARVTAFSSSTSVSAEVVADMGGTTAVSSWAEGQWSDRRGWPTAVVFHEGRLWWAGGDQVWGSVSDGFYSFDQLTEGDSGPIIRTLGSGPVDTINWMMSLQRLVLGAEGAELAARSSSLDEPLSPTAFVIRAGSTQGSDAVDAVRADRMGLFVQRCGSRIYSLVWDANDYEYSSTDLTLLVPEIGLPGVVRLAIQRQPDTRVHAIRSDGTVALLVFDPAEEVQAWCEIETDGFIEDAVILPDVEEDAVYYVVRRIINSVTVRYLERWALQSQCVGGTLNEQADAYVRYSGAATTTITDLTHLEAKSVVIWGNGVDLGTKTVTAGQITGLSTAVTSAMVGLPYTAQWRSSKLAYAANLGTGLTQRKRLTELAVILADTHAHGLRYGNSFSTLYDLPQVKDGADVAPGTIHGDWDQEAFSFPGVWQSDARLCLVAQAPRPCTVLAAVVSIETNEKR